MYNSVVEHGEDGWCSVGVGGEDDVDEVPEGTGIFLEDLEERGLDEDTSIPVIAVRLWVEGYDGRDAEYFWKSRMDYSRCPL